MRGEPLSPGPKLKGRAPGPRPRSRSSSVCVGGMAISSSRTFSEKSPHPTVSNASAVRTATVIQ